MVREGGSAEVFIRFAMVRRSVEVSGQPGQVSSETVLNKQQVRPGQVKPTRALQ